jgi:biotin-(acetyl-CoA carboxylase) ligase
LGAGVIVAQLLEKQFGIKVQIKWPNDLILGGKKLGGILCEGVSHGPESFVVVGIGVNLVQAPILADPGRAAISVVEVVGIEKILGLSLKKLSELIALGLENLKKSIESSDIVGIFLDRSTLKPLDQITWNEKGKKAVGMVLGFGPQGELNVKVNGIERKLFSEEVSSVTSGDL